MPLKHLTGERINGLSTTPTIMPIEKWQETGLFSQAAELAENAFARSDKLKKGWKGRIRGQKRRFIFAPGEVIVQVYPYERPLAAVAFIFCKVVQGKERYAPFVTKLTPGVVAQLRMTGHWPATLEIAA